MDPLAREFVVTMLDCHRRSREGVSHAFGPLEILKKTFHSKTKSERISVLRSMMRAMNDSVQMARESTDRDLLYRAFDSFDELLAISYDLDHGMRVDPEQKERLYEGAGLGVQTCYSSILLALNHVNPKQHARVLDLGSGYGRVGFVIGLLRPDIYFQGYEYVDHRVQDSKRVVVETELANVEFITQDLADENFVIPEADVYYMYDPFSKETYGSVLNQLIELGARHPLTIITKGRANTWVADALAGLGWFDTETCDSGTISLFKSRPRTA